MSKQQTGTQAIAAERQRQIDEEGYTPEHDAEHRVVELLHASIAYLHAARSAPLHLSLQWWPWPADTFKPETQTPWEFGTQPSRRDLAKAGALIAAAIDRLDQMGASR